MLSTLELLEEMPDLFLYRGEPPSCPIDGKKCGQFNPCLVEYKDENEWPFWICSRYPYMMLKELRKKKRRIGKSFLWRLFYKVKYFLFPRKEIAWEKS